VFEKKGIKTWSQWETRNYYFLSDIGVVKVFEIFYVTGFNPREMW